MTPRHFLGIRTLYQSLRTEFPCLGVTMSKAWSWQVAFLDRGGCFPIVRAKSGWPKITRDPDYLDGSHWTNEVARLCKNVGYGLTSHEYDGGQPGRFKACHAGSYLALNRRGGRVMIWTSEQWIICCRKVMRIMGFWCSITVSFLALCQDMEMLAE